MRGQTNKKYTVEHVSVDPTSPVILSHTNSLKRAKAIFDSLKKHEVEDAAKNGVSQAEWNMYLYEHPEPGAKAVPHFTEQKECYWVEYPGSKLLDKFGYMDEVLNSLEEQTPTPMLASVQTASTTGKDQP